LGPVFDAAVDDWETHLARLTRFWSVVMLGAGRFDGNPMAAHARHPITPEMFDRWLALWADVTDELFGPVTAEALQQRAARIGESLKLGLFYRPAAG
jgi:hemoglobin